MSALLDKDAGFCSGSSEHEDDHHSRDGFRSPTDTSEDSVEVKFTPISKNKRKSSEPSRVVPTSCDSEQGPLKKRFRHEEIKKLESEIETSLGHFRPWAELLAVGSGNTITTSSHEMPLKDIKPKPAEILLHHPGLTALHRPTFVQQESSSEQDQPLALIAKKPTVSQAISHNSNLSSHNSHRQKYSNASQNVASQMAEPSYENSIENLIKKTQINRLPQPEVNEINETKNQPQATMSSSSSIANEKRNKPSSAASSQRNYKNMTRERRIEANARERTRVHTISAAYDTLRRAIPAYSNTQKLSKLSVLRVAFSYILTLGRIAGEDFSADQSQPPIQDCIDAVTRTIQTEGKLRRKKEE